MAIDQISPPRMVEITGVTRTTADVIWLQPEDNGGARITGYTIERQDQPDGRWLKCNFSNVTECRFTVSSLSENTTYKFRILAKNAAGSISEPSELSDAVTCQDIFTPPRLELDSSLRDTITAKAGENVKLSAEIFGKPSPTVTWSKNRNELEHNPKSEIFNTESSTTLVLNNVSRDDTGEYLLQLKNSAGSRFVLIF